MFADPLAVTINAVAKNLIRVNQDKFSSEYFYREATYELRLKIRNTKYLAKGDTSMTERHNVELTQYVYPVSPALVGKTRKAFYTFEGRADDTIADIQYLGLALAGLLTAGTHTKLTNWES